MKFVDVVQAVIAFVIGVGAAYLATLAVALVVLDKLGANADATLLHVACLGFGVTLAAAWIPVRDYFGFGTDMKGVR